MDHAVRCSEVGQPQDCALRRPAADHHAVAVEGAGPAGARDEEVLSGPALVWFRQDLRLADNPALRSAGGRGAPGHPGLRLVAPGGGRLGAGRRLAVVAASLAARPRRGASAAPLPADRAPRPCARGATGADRGDRRRRGALEPPVRAARGRARSRPEARAGGRRSGGGERERGAAVRAVDGRDGGGDPTGLHAVLEGVPGRRTAARAPAGAVAEPALVMAREPGDRRSRPRPGGRLGGRPGGGVDARGAVAGERLARVPRGRRGELHARPRPA